MDAVSRFPSTTASRYRSMYGFGYHYRVRSAETHLKSSNSGIAATFLRECRFGMRDRNPVVAPVEYVGQLEEIIELDYSVFWQVVLIGTWVKANYRGNNASVKKDQWGFTVANFAGTIPFGRESFAFPSSCEQVFFCNCAESPGWKVVVRTEPRGQRIEARTTNSEEGLLFRHGRDSEFSTLRVSDTVSKDPVPASEASRIIRVTEVLRDEPPPELGTFDADLGASSMRNLVSHNRILNHLSWLRAFAALIRNLVPHDCSDGLLSQSCMNSVEMLVSHLFLMIAYVLIASIVQTVRKELVSDSSFFFFASPLQTPDFPSAFVQSIVAICPHQTGSVHVWYAKFLTA